ncbi:hypothetical protein [Alteraurantiacibacter aquimixticola]|uniref:Uncharacterized protein n=1 Tax=Alteraurantiacibacter aquimixticola TaxID=2489173 RepID=A0A4T3F0K7_9SPHN|nr:hypothetical protein [Alteraurantiacibacter aquimixticola]TIX50464.1 hypothetical protein E5222_09325 [Alteraurantiacibacter aquimixticola]
MEEPHVNKDETSRTADAPPSRTVTKRIAMIGGVIGLATLVYELATFESWLELTPPLAIILLSYGMYEGYFQRRT